MYVSVYILNFSLTKGKNRKKKKKKIARFLKLIYKTLSVWSSQISHWLIGTILSSKEKNFIVSLAVSVNYLEPCHNVAATKKENGKDKTKSLQSPLDLGFGDIFFLRCQMLIV